MIESHIAIDQCENCVIAAEADVFAGLKFRAALTDDDVPRDNHLAAKSFDAAPLADAIAAILDAALSFFVCHLKKLSC